MTDEVFEEKKELLRKTTEDLMHFNAQIKMFYVDRNHIPPNEAMNVLYSQLSKIINDLRSVQE